MIAFAVVVLAMSAGGVFYLMKPHPASRFDANGDGDISYKEYVAGARIMFGEIDSNQNGAIDAQDVKLLRERIRPGMGELIGWRVWGKRLDQDKDGLLRLDEMLKGGVLRKMFDAKDKDRNGLLSPAELKLSTFGKEIKN